MAYSISSSVSPIGSSSRNTQKRRSYGNNKQRKSNNNTPRSSEQEFKDNDQLSLIEQYKKWCAELKVELKQKSKINVDVRLEKMENIVNDVIDSELQSERASNFYISDDDKKEMMKKINDKIDSWRGVEIEVCRNKEKKNFEAYQATARNWFNRNKAKIYGNHLFYEIVYNHILKFCAEIEGITEEKRMTLFIDVFERILAEPVQFPRTKLQPLLPHQSLMQPNRFKKASEQFTMIYNTRWMLANNSANNSKRDRDRAKKIHTSFTNCLNQIKQQLETSSSSNPPMPFPFESIMNDTGSTTTKSVTSSTKSVSIAYEINDSVANHSPLNRNKSKSKNNNNGDFKLSMVDHSSSGSTQSTNSKDDNDDNHDMNDINDFHQDTGYVDGYDEQYLDDEYMKELPPTVEMGGFHQNPSQQQSMRSFEQYSRSRPFGNNTYMNNMIMNNINMNMNNNRRVSSSRHHGQRRNNNNHHTFINQNVMRHGIVTGNHLINDVIDEVVYEPDFKIEQMTNNNGYYDGAYTMYQSSEYPQDLNPVNNINNLNHNTYNNNNNNNNHQIQMQNYTQNSNINSNMLCVEDGVSSIPLMQQNSNIAPIQIQQPYIPQYPNTANLVTLPTLNRPFPIHTNNNNNNINQQLQYDHINDNQPIQSINTIQRTVPMLRPQQSTNSTHSSRSYVTMNANNNNPHNITPETTLTGQSSSSSADLSLSSHGSYAPSRGTNANLKAATKRHSPISTPTTPNSSTPRMRNRISNTSTSSASSSTPINYNDYTMVNNRRMIDSYQITPFSPSFDQGAVHQQQAQAQAQAMDINQNQQMMDVNIPNVPPQVMMNDGNNDNNFVFTNLSNISSPTPLLGGFL